MEVLKEKHINPLTNFGFMKIFGSDVHKVLLIDFLNALLIESGVYINDLIHYNTSDIVSPDLAADDIIKVICTDKHNKKLYVELLKPSENFFADRALYHAMRTVHNQAKSHDWHYEVDPVISISLLNFNYDSSPANLDNFIHIAQLTDTQTNNVFLDKLTFLE